MLLRLRRNEGQELVEYAFVFLILMTLILGIIEFGVVIFTQNSMSNVAREGARWAVVRRSDPNPSTYLPSVGATVDAWCDSAGNAIASQGACPKALALDPARVQVIINRPSAAEITVQANYLYFPLFGLFEPLFPTGVNLRSQSTMRLE